MKNLALRISIAGALFAAASCGPNRISMESFGTGTSGAREGDKIYVCSNYDGSGSSTESARRRNYSAALNKIDSKREKIKKVKDPYPLSGDLCTTYDVD